MRWIRIFAAALVMIMMGCQSKQTENKAEPGVAGARVSREPSPLPASEQAPPKEVESVLERSLKQDPGPEEEIAIMKTNMGSITIRFFPKVAPLAVSNFKGLAAKGYYEGVTFHRVINGFMIQGGDPQGTGTGGQSLWGKTFKDEFSPGLRFNRPGMLAMANAGPATNGSQFFITQVPTPHLDGRHTIFGEVMQGMDVVNAIGGVAKDNGDRPRTPVTIEGITIEVPPGK